MTDCVCGQHKEYTECCGRFIDNQELPTSPEELMRSRYTAYAQGNIDYISQTMKSPAADNFNQESALAFAKRVKWLKLEVISSYSNNEKGQVEFLAHFSINNKRHVIHEKSEFELIENKWFYVHGEAPNVHGTKVSKLGRNEPCLCGSGKKYKKCCGTYSST